MLFCTVHQIYEISCTHLENLYQNEKYIVFPSPINQFQTKNTNPFQTIIQINVHNLALPIGEPLLHPPPQRGKRILLNISDQREMVPLNLIYIGDTVNIHHDNGLWQIERVDQVETLPIGVLLNGEAQRGGEDLLEDTLADTVVPLKSQTAGVVEDCEFARGVH